MSPKLYLGSTKNDVRQLEVEVLLRKGFTSLKVKAVNGNEKQQIILWECFRIQLANQNIYIGDWLIIRLKHSSIQSDETSCS